jgi:hypothetical protein
MMILGFRRGLHRYVYHLLESLDPMLVDLLYCFWRELTK